jgi:preprotein translocase subunit SecD
MPKRNNLVLLMILALFAFAVWIVFPIDSNRFDRNGMQLGLDLVGGVHLDYQVDFSGNTTTDQQAAMDRTILTIKKRIDAFGVTEPVIQQLGSDRILVELPGFTDIEAAKTLVEQTGYLEFREVERNAAGTLTYLKDYLNSTSNTFIDTTETANRLFVNQITGDKNYGNLVAILSQNGTSLVFTDVNGNPIDTNTLTTYGDTSASWIPARGDDGTALTGALLSDAQTNINSTTSKPEVDITWNDQGTTIFDQIATRLHNPAGSGGTYDLKYALGIFLDNNLISAPQLLEAQYGGKGSISGSFDLAGAQELTNLLKSGSLPVQLIKPPLFQEKISATLGTDSLNLSLRAGLIGVALIALFMIIYYRALGATAIAALCVYGAISMAIFKLIPVTLTLPGIAGFIISIGMAVDANILIFERMKEEIKLGRTLDAAVKEGFHRAWPSIRDSNISTFITCIILFWFGNTFGASMVKGFALTLFLGVAVSMFSAIMVTRTFLYAVIHTELAKKLIRGSVK